MRKLLCLLLIILTGCSSGGGDDETDDRPNVSSQTTTEDKPCGDITFNIPPESFDEVVAEEVASAGEDATVIEEDLPSNLQSGALRVRRVTIITGCNNTVINQDNNSVSVSNDEYVLGEQE